MEDLRLMNRTANLAERRRKPRSASNSSTSWYEREKRKYHPTASRMTSGSNCRHLNKPQTEEARGSIRPAYHGLPAKLQHCLRHGQQILEQIERCRVEPLQIVKE